MLFAILASLVLWPPYIALELVLNIVGLVILAPMSLLRLWKPRRSLAYTSPRADHKPDLITVWRGGWLTWLWSNEEDGLFPFWWVFERHPTWHASRLAYVWAALRNPSNNLRFVPFINPVIDPPRVRFRYFLAGKKRGRITFTWQGPYAGLMWNPTFGGRMYRFWLGWKLKPEDMKGVADDDMRKPRCGWAIQFKRIA